MGNLANRNPPSVGVDHRFAHDVARQAHQRGEDRLHRQVKTEGLVHHRQDRPDHSERRILLERDPPVAAHRVRPQPLDSRHVLDDLQLLDLRLVLLLLLPWTLTTLRDFSRNLFENLAAYGPPGF